MLLAAAALTVLGGVRLARLGDVLADRTKLGEALFGAVFLGGAISLSGIVMTATAALEEHPQLAFSNAVGGVAAQTAALGVADAAYRKANLEHAAASASNMLFATLLVILLTLVLMAGETPRWTLFGVHPASLVLVAAYLLGLRAVQRTEEQPGWLPTRTRETVPDEPGQESRSNRSTASFAVRFALYALVVSAGGWAVAHATASLVERVGIEESLAGAAIMGITNALPETITSVAAVRRGAVTLAIGGVIGGNAFDVLNVAVGDVFYRDGSLYHAAGDDEVLLTLAGVLMTAIVLGGLLARQRRGPANIGLEGVLMLGVWVGALLLIGLS